MFVNHVHLMPHWLRADGTLDAFLTMADSLGIAGAVCFAPFNTQLEGRRKNPNDWLYQTIKPRANLVGYGTLDPKKPPAPQVRRIAELGFPGVKLHPAYQKFDLFGSWARGAYAAMEKAGLIADFHIGLHWHRLKDCDPLKCDEIAYHFPKLTMVYEHVGGWHWYRTVLAVITNNAHLYGGITSVLDRARQAPWYLGPEGLEECRWQIGAERLIYGTDFPYNQAPDIRRDLKIIRRLAWPKESKARLLGGNLRRLLADRGRQTKKE